MELTTNSEESSIIYIRLHELFENYRKCYKSQQTTEDDAPVAEITCKALLQQMQLLVNKELEKTEPSETEFARLLALKCALLYEEARTLAQFENEEIGVKTMAEALQLTAHYQHLPEFTFLVLKICNSSSYLESRREKYDEAYNILQEARTVYRKITDENIVDFYTVEELFSEDSAIKPRVETKTLLERLMTNNLQILSFVCNKLSRVEEYFKYSHEVVERQLHDSENEPTLWATKVGRLAFGFMSQARFWEARNHLAAAYHILNEYGCELKKKGEDAEGISTKNENFKHTEADVAKLWVKYCLYLLSASKKQLISAFYSEANDVVDNMWIPTKSTNEDAAAGDEGSVSATEPLLEAADEVPSEISPKTPSIVKNEEAESLQSDEQSSNNLEEVEEPKKNDEECLDTNEIKTEEDDSSQCKEEEQKKISQESLHLFAALDVADIEEQVTADIVDNTEQARAVVTFAHAWLRRAKIYYNIGQYPTEYINSILDLSDLYRYLAFFEEDLENQYMVQKSRADALETLNMTLRDLRPPCHLTITIELLRELAEVQLELVGLNLRRLFSIKGTFDEGDSELAPSSVLQKMGALADLHGRLEHFGDAFAYITQPFQGFCEAGNDTLQECT